MRGFASIFILITLLSHTISRAEITADSTYSALAPAAAADQGKKAEAVSAAIVSAINVITVMVQDVMQVTCETQTFLNFIKGQLLNTCTPMPLLSFAINSLMAPNTLPAFFRLAINQPGLLGYDNCSYFNRADYYNTQLQFGMCLNYNLVPQVLAAIINAPIVGLKAAIAGESSSQIQTAVQNALTLTPHQIYNTYTMSIPAGGKRVTVCCY